jgi:predicted secreted protein
METKTRQPGSRSMNVILSIDGLILGGQKNCNLTRNMNRIDITNKIDNSWSNSVAGTKDWSIECAGIYITDDEAFTSLEYAYAEGQPIEVKLISGKDEYTGRGLITSFPVSTSYRNNRTYSLTIFGISPLAKE